MDSRDLSNVLWIAVIASHLKTRLKRASVAYIGSFSDWAQMKPNVSVHIDTKVCSLTVQAMEFN